MTKGFERTTVGELAAAAGLGRRTFFRYFPTKQDVVFGALDAQLDALRRALATEPVPVPPLEAVHHGFLAVNDYPASELPTLRIRMVLLTSVPELAAHAALRYREWERVIAADTMARTGLRPGDLLPTLLARCTLAAMQAAFATWLASPDTDLRELIDSSFDALRAGLRTGSRTGSRMGLR